MTSLFPVLFVLGIVVVVGFAVLSYLGEKRRREALVAAAAARGWTYTRRDDSWGSRFAGDPFGRGHNCQAHNILQGRHQGRSFVAFEYVFHTTETSLGPNGQTTRREVSHWFSVLALETGAGLPELSVAPEWFGSRMLGKLLNRDIELESEEFNRAFSVSCPDRKFAYDILHPRLMEYLLQHRDVAWRLTGGAILTIEDGTHDLFELDSRLAVVDRVLDSVPDFVREQWGLPRAPPGNRDPGNQGPSGSPPGSTA